LEVCLKVDYNEDIYLFEFKVYFLFFKKNCKNKMKKNDNFNFFYRYDNFGRLPSSVGIVPDN